MDRYIRQENLALLSKRLPETQDEAQRKVMPKLLAEEEAKGAAVPPKGMNHRVLNIASLEMSRAFGNGAFRSVKPLRPAELKRTSRAWLPTKLGNALTGS